MDDTIIKAQLNYFYLAQYQNFGVINLSMIMAFLSPVKGDFR